MVRFAIPLAIAIAVHAVMVVCLSCVSIEHWDTEPAVTFPVDSQVTTKRPTVQIDEVIACGWEDPLLFGDIKVASTEPGPFSDNQELTDIEPGQLNTESHSSERRFIPKVAPPPYVTTCPGPEVEVDWLLQHQTEDGFWDADAFGWDVVDLSSIPNAGYGQPDQDIGVTALALLAYLSNGSSTRHGPHRPALRKGIKWLDGQQDPATGRFGDTLDTGRLRNHALATWAYCENYTVSRHPFQKRTAQQALDFLAKEYRLRTQEVGSHEFNEVETLAWLVCAMRAGERARLEVETSLFTEILEWLNVRSLPTTGCVIVAHPSSLPMGASAKATHPDQHPETSNAASLLIRTILQKRISQRPILRNGLLQWRKQPTPVMIALANRLAQHAPKPNQDASQLDLHFLHLTTLAMRQMNGQYWKQWNRQLIEVMRPLRYTEGPLEGSFDPHGPSSVQGGRVHATATGHLIHQSCYMYCTLVTGDRLHDRPPVLSTCGQPSPFD